MKPRDPQTTLGVMGHTLILKPVKSQEQIAVEDQAAECDDLCGL